MKTTILMAAIPALLTLTACGETAEIVGAPEGAAEVDDDNDTAEPVAEPHDEDEPHDDSVPHDH